MSRETSETWGTPYRFCRLGARITAGVNRGISAGIIAHHTTGSAMNHAAAASSAATTHRRTAILFAQEATGRTLIEASTFRREL